MVTPPLLPAHQQGSRWQLALEARTSSIRNTVPSKQQTTNLCVVPDREPGQAPPLPLALQGKSTCLVGGAGSVQLPGAVHGVVSLLLHQAPIRCHRRCKQAGRRAGRQLSACMHVCMRIRLGDDAIRHTKPAIRQWRQPGSLPGRQQGATAHPARPPRTGPTVRRRQKDLPGCRHSCAGAAAHTGKTTTGAQSASNASQRVGKSKHQAGTAGGSSCSCVQASRRGGTHLPPRRSSLMVPTHHLPLPEASSSFQYTCSRVYGLRGTSVQLSYGALPCSSATGHGALPCSSAAKRWCPQPAPHIGAWPANPSIPWAPGSMAQPAFHRTWHCSPTSQHFAMHEASRRLRCTTNSAWPATGGGTSTRRQVSCSGRQMWRGGARHGANGRINHQQASR